MDDIVTVPMVLTPTLLNKVISDNNSNNGSTFSVYHLGVTDSDVLRFIPNPESSDQVASCYNSTSNSISLPSYQYAVIKYYYELEPGTTQANAVGNRQSINFSQLSNGNPTSVNIESADKIILGGTSAHKSIIDLNAITARTGYTGYLQHFHFSPYGNMLGNQLASTELMNIESISFYAEYPYANQYEIEVALDKTIGTQAQTISLTGKDILPSAHKYAIVKYTAKEDATVTLGFAGLYGGDYSASKAAPAAMNEIIIPLSEIAKSGQMYYYENVALSADKEIDIESITFSVYPNPDAVFSVSFDANGGKGTVPEAVSGKIGSVVTLPTASLERGTQLFLGWGLTPDATETVSKFVIPIDGTTLYAIYADAATLTYDANGGTGTVPPSVKVLIGEKTALVDSELTKDGAIFIGWGTTANATVPVSTITMDADGVTVYAIYRELETLYVTNNASGKLTYNGEEVTADYATLGEALTALGANGGHIIFTGCYEYTDFFNKQNSSAPIVILEGADDGAILRFESTINTGTGKASAVSALLRCDTTFKNIKLLKGIHALNTVSDLYIKGNGKTLIIQDGTATYNESRNGINNLGSETQLQGYDF